MPSVCAGGLSFLRGDCNADAEVNLADAVCMLSWLFGGAEEPACLSALDTNGDAGIDIADPVSLLNFLFGGGPVPVQPFPDCGPEKPEANGNLGCVTPPSCAG